MSFPKETIEKTELILGQILFNDYQKLVAGGDKKAAIKGYLSLFENPKYPKKIKAKSAYNASLLYLDLDEVDESFTWLKKSIPLFEMKEVLPLTSTIESIAVEYFERLNFDKTAELSSYALNKFCGEKKVKKNMFFHFASLLYFVEDERKKSISTLKMAEKCGISKKQLAQTENQILEFASLSENHNSFFKVFKYFHKKAEYAGSLNKILFHIYKFHGGLKGDSYARKSKKYLDKYLDPKDKFSEYIASHIKTEEFLEKHKNFKISAFDQGDAFDENTYNTWLQNQINVVTKLTEEGVELAKLGYGDLRISVYQILNSAYGKLAKSISLVVPLGKDKNYLKGFKGNMAGIQNGLKAKAYEFTYLAKLQVNKHKVLHANGSWVLTPKSSPVQLSYSYIYSGILMDTVKGI